MARQIGYVLSHKIYGTLGRAYNTAYQVKEGRLSCSIGSYQTAQFSLGHGEKRRMELGISLACEPKLLLLDEPAAGLTIAETEGLIPVIKEISSQKVSILVIEHDMKFVKDIADTITVLHHGEILVEGSPDEIENNEDVKSIYMGGEQDWY